MPLFTICNIGLGCPYNVSVKFQAKIPHRSFIITAGKCHFWGGSKNERIWSVCKLYAYSRPVSRRVYVSLCIAYLQRWTAGRSNITESERTGFQPYIIWDETARWYRACAALTCHRTELRDRGTKWISRYEWHKLISQVRHPQHPQLLRCWEKMKDSVTAEGGNYSNAWLSIKPCDTALRNMSHCGESQEGRPCETDLV